MIRNFALTCAAAMLLATAPASAAQKTPDYITAAVDDSEHPCRRVGDHLHGPFEGHELATAQHVAEEASGVGRAAHAVEVCAGVRAAEHHRGVVPGLATQFP